ncbi:class I SAM-dependent methyltransferase [Gordonia sp. VNQ95]|jgi:predicted O-methyltransferase YrrM|uniref:O-methyltransferase n=1 Tax=Gordonia TaxID=2053 RepID=UPI0032B418CF
MASTLQSEPVRSILDELYERARQGGRPPGPRPGGAPPMDALSPQEHADAMADRYMAIGRDTGVLAYSLIRAARPSVVVEFGMSYGVSALFIASALRDNGSGHLYTTELSGKKVAAASATFADAGLDDLITVLEGDARETLTTVTDEIGFVLLDGWKDLYTEILALLEPRLRPGALILADNTDSPGAAPYLDVVRAGGDYTGVPLPGKHGDSVELSCRL